MSETLFDRSGLFAANGARLDSGYPLVDNSRFVFMIALAVDVMLFSVLIGTFFVLREGASSWPPSDLSGLSIPVAAFGAASLLLASIFLSLTVWSQHHNALGRFRFCLGGALLFLAAFLALNITEWRAFLATALPIHAVFGGLFLTLTGLFHLHVIAAFCYIVGKYRGTLRWQRYTRSGVSMEHLTSFVVAMFVVWMGIIAVVYL